MKLRYLLLLLTLACSKPVDNDLETEASAPSDEITFIIDNPDGDMVFFQWFSLFNNGMVPPYESVKKSDTVQIISDLPIIVHTITTQPGNFIDFKVHIYYVNKGETVLIKKEAGDPPILSIADEEQRNNELNFSIKYQEKFGNLGGFGYKFPFSGLNFGDRITKIKERYQNQSVFLDEFIADHPVSSNFKNLISDLFYYKQYRDFFGLYNNVDKKSDMYNDEQVNQFVDEFKFNENTSDLTNYSYALQAVGRFRAKSESPVKVYSFAKENLKGKDRDLLMFSSINHLANISHPETADLIDDFLRVVETDFLKEEIEETLLEHVRLVDLERKSELQGAILIDYNNNSQISWADFLDKNKGKLLYVDFWASWCAPCVAEMPYSLQLKEELENLPIEFVYLSQDNSTSHWSRGVEKYGLSSVSSNYLLGAGNKSKILQHYKISAIPHYMIFDQEGKLVNSNAPRPSSKGILSTLQEMAK